MPADKMTGSLTRVLGYLNRQPHDWKVTAGRTSIYRFFYQMLLPYLSVYILALGATGTQLGLINSIGMVVAGLFGPLTGWLMDRFGTKTIYLVGIALLALSWTLFGIAQSWPIIIFAMLSYWLGFRTSVHGCAFVCANTLSTKDRVTSMSCCETLAAGLLGVVGPLLGAWIVSSFGGVNVSGIRPLFFISLVGTIFTFFLILNQLSNQKWGSQDKPRTGLLESISEVFKKGHHLKRFILVAVINYIPIAMIIPFTQPFANEVKGANAFVMGAMVTGSALTPLVLGIPLGRLADRIGRKKTLFWIAPLFWASCLMLIWAPNSTFLITAGVLQGFYWVSEVIVAAMMFELVPPEHMGRWLGVMTLFRLCACGLTSLGAGLIWDNISPQWVFLTVIALDAFIKIPILIGLPETSRLKKT
jgi:MFS family permease